MGLIDRHDPEFLEAENELLQRERDGYVADVDRLRTTVAEQAAEIERLRAAVGSPVSPETGELSPVDAALYVIETLRSEVKALEDMYDAERAHIKSCDADELRATIARVEAFRDGRCKPQQPWLICAGCAAELTAALKGRLMTHTKPMADSEGTFSDEHQSERPCRECSGLVTYHTWDSSCGAYTDYRYTCTECGHGWWVEGSDS